MGLDIRHQVLRVALSVKVNGKRRRLSLHRARPPRTCVKLSMKITVTTSRVGAYPHTQKSGLRRLTGAYPHTKISVAQSYPDPYLFGIQAILNQACTGASSMNACTCRMHARQMRNKRPTEMPYPRIRFGYGAWRARNKIYAISRKDITKECI